MIKKLVLAAALATIGTGSALADTFNAGLVTPGTPVTNTFTHTAAGWFSDTFNFTIGAGTVSTSAVSIDLNIFNMPIFQIAGLTGTLWNNSHPNGTVTYGVFSGNNNTFSFGPLAAGNYHIDFTGNATGVSGGAYLAAVSVAAVPEPETYALLLAGLGLMGTVARRRSRNAA